ncbi:bifunctional DedA family/phosphatase PAP2 family protein [Candidatus Thiosymbion oneisti]|uniref:bifunctional DedA family/phosphatase PAP2 family protein n=1 Tax=Candidatus Thiosymbion oneisti TaxID=589554 RepID=UPI0010613D49|nr:bifunctional DedA family/phosphatase PAP2 family protein [Candidatus Thiosymbion oneisti]
MAELLRDLLTWVAANPGWAYLGVFLVALTESLAIVGLMVPGAIMMVGTGTLIAAGALDFWPVCLWAIVGAVVGDGLSYWLGRHYRERLTSLWPFTRYPDSLAGGVRFFEKYGGKSVAFGRFVGPIRAVIPLVAGMLGMPVGRFLVANILSAIAWAPAYLLPGIVFGASLELAAEAAFHLVLLLLALAVVVWAVAWGVRQVFLRYSPRAKGWIEGLLRRAEFHPRMGEIARALADPGHPDAATLTALAGVLLLTTLLFALVTGFTVAGASDLPLNRTVLHLALSLQTPTANQLMAGFSRLGDLAVILPLILVVCGWLYRRGEHRHANYWLAAGTFAILAGPLLGYLLQIPRPDPGPDGLTPWAFPSGHTLRATVVYGFLAVVLAGGMTPTWRWLPYAWAGMLITLVGISRLYFGAHWLTAVLGSLTLGLAWVATLGLAYRRHRESEPAWHRLGSIALGTCAVAFGLQSILSQDPDPAFHDRPLATTAITDADWRTKVWRILPQTRDDLRQAGHHPLNLQYAGQLADLRDQLAHQGWEPGPRLSWGRAIKLLSPSLPLAELPVIPHVHEGRHEALTLVKQGPGKRRLVLRLWPTSYRIDGETPLWIGNVTAQHKRVVLDLLAVPTTDADTHSPLDSVQEDLSTLHPFRPDQTAPLLLQATSVPP